MRGRVLREVRRLPGDVFEVRQGRRRQEPADDGAQAEPRRQPVLALDVVQRRHQRRQPLHGAGVERRRRRCSGPPLLRRLHRLHTTRRV